MLSYLGFIAKLPKGTLPKVFSGWTVAAYLLGMATLSMRGLGVESISFALIGWAWMAAPIGLSLSFLAVFIPLLILERRNA